MAEGCVGEDDGGAGDCGVGEEVGGDGYGGGVALGWREVGEALFEGRAEGVFWGGWGHGGMIGEGRMASGI